MSKSPWANSGATASATPSGTGIGSQAGVDAANAGIGLINDPDTLSVDEKPQILQDYSTLTGENAGLVAKANSLSVSHSAYDTAYTALVTTYLPTLTSPTAWNSLAGVTSLGAGNRVALWNPKWLALRSAANDLKAALASGAFTLATASAATDAANKALDAINKSQLHQVAWASSALPALPSSTYPAGYLAQTTDNRKFQVNAGGTAWGEITQAAIGIFGQLVANQLTVANFDNLIPNPNSEQAAPAGGWPSGAYEGRGVVPYGYRTGTKCRTLWGTGGYPSLDITPLIPCSVGDSYLLLGYGFRATLGAGNARLYLMFLAPDGITVTGFISTEATTTWYPTNPNVCSMSAPAGSSWVIIRMENDLVPNLTDVYWDDLYLRRMADGNLIVDGAITANKLAVDLATANVIRSANWDGSSSVQSTLGYKISGTGFTAKAADGSTATVQADFASATMMGGYLVGGITARAMTAFNRIVNGIFYRDMTGWYLVGVMNWSATSYDGITGSGSAALITTNSVNGYDYGQCSQAFSVPPPTGTVNFTCNTMLRAGIYDADGYVTVTLTNCDTGVDTTLATWTYGAKDNAWTARSVSITSLVSGGGSFLLSIWLRARTNNAGSGMYVDNVKIIL